MSKEALLEAVIAGDVEAAGAALEAGASPDTRDTRGRTVLMLAALAGHEELVRTLLSAGASPNRRTPSQEETALHLLARRNGSARVAKVMLAQRVRIDRLDVYGWSPLMVALRAGHQELVEVLVQAGADVELRTPDGRSVVELAAEEGIAL